METWSWHSSQSAWAMAIKNNSFVEAIVKTILLYHPNSFWGVDFWICFLKFCILVAMVTNQIKRLQQKGMFCRGPLKEHFCKTFFQNICIETAVNANFHFSHYKSMATVSCHSNQSSYPIGTKNNSFLLPIDAICEIWWESASWLQRRCRLKMLTTTTDGRRIPAYTISSPMSLRLRWAKNKMLNLSDLGRWI